VVSRVVGKTGTKQDATVKDGLITERLTDCMAAMPFPGGCQDPSFSAGFGVVEHFPIASE
jgi:hypothetical protein